MVPGNNQPFAGERPSGGRAIVFTELFCWAHFDTRPAKLDGTSSCWY